ncbi:hypothetical protein BMETH_163_3 [methanotrophic bacterial endosymbiont of Bathymodiolus sp.]|nr:hypothetical protein BMETH_163_3 [methanotrophic bacterial endosymbiont of Bathymodiolus sp.]
MLNKPPPTPIINTLPGCSLNNSQAIIALTYFECN